MKFLEIFGSRSDSYYNVLADFETSMQRELKFKKDWCKTFLVKVTDIIRIQQFQANGETYYLVIVANQYGQGNLGKEKNELGLIVDDGEYVQIKEALNQ
jgi:hypothetical protein